MIARMASCSLGSRRMIVLGGSHHHPGGLEAFCQRATAAIEEHATGWEVEWWPTDTAYLRPSGLGAVSRDWMRVASTKSVDLVWLQWSTLTDLAFLCLAKARGLPVIVTPHLGANSRLQRSMLLRGLCVRLLAGSDQLALLFDEQPREIALPASVPRATIGTFLPQVALAASPAERTGDRLSLIHAGRLSAGKGTFRVIALCTALRARGVPFHAEIVGRSDAATRAALAQSIVDAALEDSIALVDWMEEPALIAALEQADVLVHLSELDSFPLIVLEALAAGAVPVVADMAGASSMVRHYGGFVSSSSSVDGAADWLASQNVSELRHRASVAAARVRHDQGWRSIVARFEAIADTTLRSTKSENAS
jgi:glycosyltransferase involved in cell wall biosynthesis